MRAALACLLVATGNGAEAYELIRDLQDGPHDSQLDGELEFTAGQALFLVGRRAEALEWLERAAAAMSLSDPERALVRTEAAVARLFGSGDIAGAQRDVASAEAETGGDPYAPRAAPQVLVRLGQPQARRPQVSAWTGVSEVVPRSVNPCRSSRAS